LIRSRYMKRRSVPKTCDADLQSPEAKTRGRTS
jgi:hypothetical protein